MQTFIFYQCWLSKEIILKVSYSSRYFSSFQHKTEIHTTFSPKASRQNDSSLQKACQPVNDTIIGRVETRGVCYVCLPTYRPIWNATQDGRSIDNGLPVNCLCYIIANRQNRKKAGARLYLGCIDCVVVNIILCCT